MPIARQQPRERRDHARADGAGDPAVQAPIVLVEIALVAAEQLVAADPREDHRDVLARELRHEVGRDERRVGDRLVHVPDQIRQQRRHVRLHDDLVMIGAELLGHLPRVRQLVVELRAGRALEPDRIGLDRLRAVTTHERHDRARIDAARKERADRHVADHLVAHRALELGAHGLDPLLLAAAAVDLRRQAVVAVLAHLAALRNQRRARLELAHPLEDRVGCADVAHRQVLRERSRIEARLERPGTARIALASEANISSRPSRR